MKTSIFGQGAESTGGAEKPSADRPTASVTTLALVEDPINILIVDDEPKNLTVLESILDDPGYRLVRAESADQALLALLVEEFALLILDIRMPGVTGFELAQMIKERKKTARVPIIFLTAYYSEDQHVLEGYGAGAVDYLHKPVNAAILRSKVAVFAELHRKTREIGAANRTLLAEVAMRRRVEEELRQLNETLEQRVTDGLESLRQSQERIMVATEATEVGVWEWSLGDNTVCWDAQMFRLYGVAPTQDGMVPYRVWAEAVHPDDLAEQEELSRQHARDGGIYHREFRIRRHDREIRVIHSVESIRHDAKGKISFIGTNLDVTERKRAEQVLRQSEERNSFLLELGDALKPLGNPDNIKEAASRALGLQIGGHQVVYAEIDASGEIATIARDWNDGRMPSNVGAHRIADFGPEFVADLRAGKSVVIDDVKADVRTCSPESRATFQARSIESFLSIPLVKDGRLACVLSVHCHSVRHWSDMDVLLAEDVAERTWAAVAASQAAKDLRVSQGRLRAAADASGLTYADVDLVHGRVQAAENFEQVMGYAPLPVSDGWADLAESQGRLLEHVVAGDRSRVEAAFEHFSAGEPQGKVEFRVLGNDAAERWIEATWQADHDRNGAPRRAFLTGLDVTAQVQSRIALAAAKTEAERANLAKSRFLAATSHDLRQPVQSLVLLISVAQNQTADLPKANKTVNMMQIAVDSLQRLLGAVLDISRLDAGVVAPAMEAVDLSALLMRLQTEYATRAAAKGIELRRAPRRLFARSDPGLLERALRNLIENALRYTSDGGILVGVRRRGDLVRIDILDTGVGIPADKQSDIFEEFHQLQNPGRNLERGLGLGLAIVNRLAKLLGAQIEVASKLGRGSRFSLLLPFVQDENAEVKSPQRIIDDQGGRVLIIEDNAIVRQSLEAMLNEWGYETLTAASGEEALDLAAKKDWRLDFVIADHRLGAGLNGVATVREIERRAGREFLTLVLTGDTAKEQITDIIASGFEVMHKPVTATHLRQKLAQLSSS